MTKPATKPFEILQVHDTTVACDGGAEPLGHPRVFLHIDRFTGHIQCPYCSRLYVLQNAAHGEAD